MTVWVSETEGTDIPPFLELVVFFRVEWRLRNIPFSSQEEGRVLLRGYQFNAFVLSTNTCSYGSPADFSYSLGFHLNSFKSLRSLTELYPKGKQNYIRKS